MLDRISIDPADIELPATQPIDITDLLRESLRGTYRDTGCR